MTVRSSLVEQFEADFAAIAELEDVWVVATQEELTAFTRVTVIVSQQSMGPFPPAPLSSRYVGIVLEVVAPSLGLDQGADELEEIVPALLDYVDKKFHHTTATAFPYGERFAYRIPINVIASKES